MSLYWFTRLSPGTLAQPARLFTFSRLVSQHLLIEAISKLDPFQSQIRWLP